MQFNANRSLVILLAAGMAALSAGSLRAIGEAPLGRAPFNAAPKTAVGLVNLEKLMKDLQEIKAMNADLKVTFDARQKELDDLSTKGKALEKEIEVLAADSKERRNKQAQLYEMGQLAKTRQAVLQRLIDLDKGELVRAMYTKVAAAVDSFAQKEGFDLIILDDRSLDLPASGTQNEMNATIQAKRVMFAAQGLDITDRIATLMNAEYAAPAKKR